MHHHLPIDVELPVEYLPCALCRRRGSRRCFENTRHRPSIRLFPALFSIGFLSKNRSISSFRTPTTSAAHNRRCSSSRVRDDRIRISENLYYQLHRKPRAIRARVYKQTKFSVIYLR